METRLKYFSFIKIPAWLSPEFSETMFLLIDGSGAFDKAIEEDRVSHAIARPGRKLGNLGNHGNLGK